MGRRTRESSGGKPQSDPERSALKDLADASPARTLRRYRIRGLQNTNRPMDYFVTEANSQGWMQLANCGSHVGGPWRGGLSI